MNVPLVTHQGFTKGWYWASSSDVKFDMVTGSVIVGDGHALRVDPHTKRCIYPTHLCDPKFKAVSYPMTVVCQDVGVYVYKEKSANLPYYPEHAVRLENMHNNIPDIPSHSTCFVCRGEGESRELVTCNLCLLTSHQECIDVAAFVFPDTVHARLPMALKSSGSMRKCCAQIKLRD